MFLLVSTARLCCREITKIKCTGECSGPICGMNWDVCVVHLSLVDGHPQRGAVSIQELLLLTSILHFVGHASENLKWLLLDVMAKVINDRDGERVKVAVMS